MRGSPWPFASPSVRPKGSSGRRWRGRTDGEAVRLRHADRCGGRHHGVLGAAGAPGLIELVFGNGLSVGGIELGGLGEGVVADSWMAPGQFKKLK